MQAGELVSGPCTWLACTFPTLDTLPLPCRWSETPLFTIFNAFRFYFLTTYLPSTGKKIQFQIPSVQLA